MTSDNGKANLVAIDYHEKCSGRELKNANFFYTLNYLVITTKKQLLWIERKKIFTGSSTFKASFRSLPIDQFPDTITQSGFRTFCATAHNVNISDKGDAWTSTDVIQISFSDIVLLWDLKDDKEITFNERLD